MKICGFLFVVLVGVSSFCSAAPKNRVTPDTLRARIEAEGARTVLSTLWADEQNFEALLDPVQAGKTEWFAVWVTLRKVSDGAAALSIDFSFPRALPLAPERVLRLIGKGLEFNFTCTSPFIEPEPGVAEAYERKTLAALARVRDPELKLLASRCAERVKLKH